MKNFRIHIFLAFVTMASFLALKAGELPRDTVFFYDTWEQMFYMQPSAYIVAPYIEASTPYEVFVYTGNDELDEKLLSEHAAITIDEGCTWLISSEYLKKNFKGDTKKMSGFMPLFFDDKVAFVMYVGYGTNVSLKNILFGETDEDMDYSEYVDYYYIDFMNRKVLKVTPSVLSDLLEDYHDLQMRYEGMKDFKKRYIIEDYFYKFIDRASEDVMRPYILDLVD